MKKLSAFETSIIGFLFGAIVAAYLTFTIANEHFVGRIIEWVSLRPLFDLIPISESYSLTLSFIFIVLVYTIYGALVGLIINKTASAKTLVTALALVITGSATEQILGSATIIPASDYAVASVYKSIKKVPQAPQQYFGLEASGDLNADGKDDIAFIIHRNDAERGTLYYLTSALAGEVGKTGTNLVFLGDKVTPLSISISEGIISIVTDTTEALYGRVVNGALELFELL